MRKILLTVAGALNFGFIFSCGWDYDTIAMEKQEFPSIHELITGKFLRHSTELYYWRTLDRAEDIKNDPDSLELYDDLAWAYDKLGKHQEAIRVMKKKDSIEPGIYETYANLGTSFLHAGELKAGLEYIRKAIEINPEAHFGREVYQQYLVEYILKVRRLDSAGNLRLPLGPPRAYTFYHFLKDRHIDSLLQNGSTEKEELAKAIKGVAGMMKFGNYKSPILLEVLGHLLSNYQIGNYPGAGHLASRAFLKASFQTKGQSSRMYRTMASYAIERFYGMEIPRLSGDTLIGIDPRRQAAHHYMTINSLEKALKNEIEAAEKWFDTIRTNELSWIKSGVNPDSAFSASYYDQPEQEPAGENPYALNLNEPDEEFWLEQQLNTPEHIRTIYQGMALDDSTKSMLDSIYDAEFSHYNPPPPKKAASLPGQQAPEDNYTGKIMLILGIGGILVFIFLIGYLIRKRK